MRKSRERERERVRGTKRVKKSRGREGQKGRERKSYIKYKCIKLPFSL